MPDDSTLALFIDAENLILSCSTAGIPFRPGLILDRLREEGVIRYARAYADWSTAQMGSQKKAFQTNVIEMSMLSSDSRGKNTGDVQIALDALEMALQPAAPGTFVLATGDRDFVPLAQKLKRYGFRVIGVGVEGSISQALASACDLYLFYEDLDKEAGQKQNALEPSTASPAASPGKAPQPAPEPARVVPEFELLLRAIVALERRGEQALGAKLGLMMRQLDATFEPGRYGYSSFKDLVTAASDAGYVSVRTDALDLLVERLRDPAARQRTASETGSVPFSDRSQLLEDYRQVLAEKRIPLLPCEVRGVLVRALWEVLAANPEGLSAADMTVHLGAVAENNGLNIPVQALKKVILTLYYGRCFICDTTGNYLAGDDVCKAGVSAEEAVSRMDQTYVRGIVIEYRNAPLEERAVSELLYGDTTPESLNRAREVIRQIQLEQN